MIDFALVTKMFHKNGKHRKQEPVTQLVGNPMFASETMVRMLSTSRKDDLESIMYLLCFLLNGSLPIIDYIDANIDFINLN